ncbi:MAG TPA: ABC transporter substrate-binding protein [Ramlibacter sp.]|nr:ABC transporter substrate-binding protein [Ramlibacter sp.]
MTTPPLSRRQFARLTATAALVASVALGGAAQAQAPQKVLTVGNPFAPLSLDPSLSGNGRAGTHLMPAYEPLVRVRPDGSFEPALATAWEMSPDSRQATFTLRRDARFSDGGPVNAEAVKKSVDYFRNKKAGPFAVNLANVTAIDVVDPYKVRFTLSAPNPAFLNLFEAYWLAGDIISPKALGNPDSLAKETFGAGPYKLDPAATVTGKTYTYVPNPHYYDKSRIKWDRIVLSVFEDQNAAIQAMKAGQVKFLVSDPVTGHANTGKLPKNIRTISEPVQWTGLVIVDRGGAVNPALKDVRVRQAINHALDRKLIAKALLGEFARPTLQLQGPGFFGNDPALEAKYGYDPAKAKELLTAAGFGKGLDVKLSYVNNTLSRTMAQVAASQFKKVGINATLDEFQGFGAMNAAAANKQIQLLMFNSNFGVPNLARFQTLAPKGSLNFYGSEDAELTKLMDEAANTPMARAEPAWKKVYAKVVDLAWFAPVAATNIVYFATDDVKVPKIGQTIVIDLVNVEPAR